MSQRHGLLLLCGMLLGCISPHAAAQEAPAIAGSAIDHIGVNVPDAGQAATFFHDLLGTRIVYDLHPGPVDAAWKKRFRWHPSAQIRRIILIELPGGGARIELFEYDAPDAAREQPHEDDPGATHISFRARDMKASIAALKARGLRILNEPGTLPDGSRWFYFLSPWGSQLELIFPPEQ